MSEEPSAELVRAARRRWTSGVAVVLTAEDDGFRGATVTSFTIVSLEPPLILVCLAIEAAMASLVPAKGIFTVSILERAHEFQAERFAGRAPLPDKWLTGVPFDRAGNGLPVLRAALAWFACSVLAVHEGGDHLIVVGSVEETGLGGDADDPLAYYDGRYRRLN